MTIGDLCKGVGLACLVVTAVAAAAQLPASRGTVASFYDLKTSYLNGTPADLGQFRGKVTLVVNVASQCGFTPQYEGLEKLHRELSGAGFSVRRNRRFTASWAPQATSPRGISANT